MRRLIVIAAAVALCGCETLGLPNPLQTAAPAEDVATPAPAAAAAAPPRPSQRALQQQLFEVERQLAAAAQAQGYGAALAGALDAGEGFVVRPGAMLQGGDQVLQSLGSNVAGGPIFWAPDRIHVSESGDMGMTSGRYVEVDAQSRAVQGRYVVVWRRAAGGEWRVLSETRTPDPARRR